MDIQGTQHAILDALPNAIIAYDAALRVTAWNAATARANGVSREDAIGRSLLELFPYIRGTPIEEEYRRALAGETVDARDRCWTPTGQEQPRWFDVCYLPVRDASGAVVGGLVTTSDVTARREVSDELARERHLLRTVIDAAPFGLIAFDASFVITEWNAYAERTTGLRRADVVGRQLLGVLPDLAGTEVMRDYESALAGETVRVRDRWYDSRFGGRRCYDATFVPLHDGRGAVTGGVMLALDVTERANAEAAERESRRAVEASAARYRMLFEQSAAMQMLIDAETLRIVDANARAVEFYGYPHDTLIGTPADKLLVGAEELLGVHAEPGFVEGENQLRRVRALAAGGARETEVCATAFTRGIRKTIHLVMHDVTARVHAEAERDRLISIIEASPDIVGTADARARTITYVNRAGRELLGIGPEERDLEIRAFVLDEDADYIFGHVVPRAIHEGSWRGEARVRARDGRVIPMSAVVVTHFDPSGAPDYLSTVLRDRTVEKQREAELAAARERAERASGAKTAFLAGMSHELRTPLGAVIGFAQLLRDGHGGALTDKQREYLDDVLMGARHLRVVVDDALDLARIEAGIIDIRPELLDIPTLVEETLVTAAGLAAERGVRLEHSIDPGVRQIVADPARVRQVLLNYLTNAIKFNRAGGQAIVEVIPEGDTHVRFVVRDTGRGIAEENLPRLFVEFQRLGVHDVSGSGLGLAITRRIVESMGGSVGVASRRGAGSSFHAVLPRVPVRATEPPRQAREGSLAGRSE